MSESSLFILILEQDTNICLKHPYHQL